MADGPFEMVNRHIGPKKLIRRKNKKYPRDVMKVWRFDATARMNLFK